MFLYRMSPKGLFFVCVSCICHSDPPVSNLIIILYVHLFRCHFSSAKVNNQGCCLFISCAETILNIVTDSLVGIANLVLAYLYVVTNGEILSGRQPLWSFTIFRLQRSWFLIFYWKWYFWVSKNSIFKCKYVYMVYIFVQSFGWKEVLFWATEK